MIASVIAIDKISPILPMRIGCWSFGITVKQLTLSRIAKIGWVVLSSKGSISWLYRLVHSPENRVEILLVRRWLSCVRNARFVRLHVKIQEYLFDLLHHEWSQPCFSCCLVYSDGMSQVQYVYNIKVSSWLCFHRYLRCQKRCPHRSTLCQTTGAYRKSPYLSDNNADRNFPVSIV